MRSNENIDSGKNVCIYYLFGNCKFGDVKCIYSHSKEYLDDGWWNNEEDAEMANIMMMVAKEGDKEDGDIDNLATLLRRGGFGKYGRDVRAAVAHGTCAGRGRFTDYEERMMNCGFTQSEVEELLCQGVKPWDDDAQV